ncbi:MAG TPA: ornithine cyclodeaminase family protein [Pyrinomonadaceae bacterium]|nr:ornithine cyclodeaminase family protein [Pyrinomonadaceae bacterium]
MKILVLTAPEVEELLSMKDCIEVMADALAALARNEVDLPLRSVLRPTNADGLMAMMPAYRQGKAKAFGLKAICVFPENPRLGKDAHQGFVMLFSGETGEPLALMNASAITAIRTAAVSALATRLLAREDACELALIGSGVQARTHLSAISCVRRLRRVRVTSRNHEHARQLAAEMKDRFPFPIVPLQSVEESVHAADLIVTATTSPEPVLRREWISPGTHINAVGTYSAAAREVDGATMAAARIFVDRRESALNESGDYVLAAREGLIGPESILAEIGEVLIGEKNGRTAADEITLFKSLGLAIEDVASAQYLLSKAQKDSRGTWIDF